MPGSQRPEGRVTSRGETLWCAQFMPKLGKRENWDEQEAQRKGRGSLFADPIHDFAARLGLRWQAKRDAALEMVNHEPRHRPRAGSGDPAFMTPWSRMTLRPSWPAVVGRRGLAELLAAFAEDYQPRIARWVGGKIMTLAACRPPARTRRIASLHS